LQERKLEDALKWSEENPVQMDLILQINSILEEVEDVDVIKLCRAKSNGDRVALVELLKNAPVSQTQVDLYCLEYLLDGLGIKDSIDLVEYLEKGEKVDLTKALEVISSKWSKIK
jgi:hypothetical protein